ncbi:hypothetical protein OK074_8118 [Actinobacteria bacterium OK074]|nr:hypothetical protein OK074_8118 [Actinobacteria bacterium OK074]
MPEPAPADRRRSHPSPGATAPSAYDAWRHHEPTAWRDRHLHWHAYSWRGDANRLHDNVARRSAAESIVPFTLKDWLSKSDSLIRLAPTSPEEALAWLRKQFDDCAPLMSPTRQRDFTSTDTRFGLALYQLRCGNDLSWGFWLTNRAYQALSLITVDSRTCAAGHATEVNAADRRTGPSPAPWG